MILLDTDHLSVLKYVENPKYTKLVSRLHDTSDPVVATTIVSIEEQLRGWLAKIHGVLDFHKQILPYDQLAALFNFFKRWNIVPFDSRAANASDALRKHRLRIGMMDLKIAAIALVNDSLLLSANLRDFQKVPGLRVESWLD